MAEQYPIVPLSFVDGLHDVNNALKTYHELLEAWVQSALNEGAKGDKASFTAGLVYLRQPIHDQLEGMISDCNMARVMGMKGSVSLLDDTDLE